ncbi:hypothetical protein FNQ90_09245 [Streptomyces alkaliphilus]|uniref:Uncharacterized protein n=1 Tax=Streptomyces alkaliphilus TaxID=1472722 RepID=A0A7W3Y1I0_9ACTN|nr:hypothetical protein [Streptomyces alkaliphilus]MBB0244285.1 hypothetical protein [Streptomyces alkaliphilus]
MAGFEDLKAAAGVDFDFSPGAQIPLSGAGGGRTQVSAALAATSYRDGDVRAILEVNDGAKVTDPRISLLEPNLGEAFTRAIETRMLAPDRAPLVQSFGAEPQTVVEHALAAKRIRRQRDRRLTTIMAVLGVLFLPGVLVWLGLFQLRRTLAGAQDKRAGSLGILALAAVFVLIVLFVYNLELGGLLQLYVWALLPAPILGWFLAQRVCERTARNLRAHWSDLLGGGGSGARVPEAVPQNPNDAEAERLRKGLAKISAEQSSNMVHYAGPKGILGMGPRWGRWSLAEDLFPADPQGDMDGFRAWDVARAMYDDLRMVNRGPLHTGGFRTAPELTHWVVRHVGEGAGSISRPDGPHAEGYSMTPIEVQRICNEEHHGANDRHYLGARWVMHDGNLVINYLTRVSVLHRVLRVEFSAYALGPVKGFFLQKPAAKKATTRHPFKPWKKVERELPLVDVKEVVRLAARAPLTWFPAELDKWGGKLSLPEPFGLRHAWAEKPWRHRFMTDDALDTTTPVVREAMRSLLRVLRENRVDVGPFEAKVKGISGAVENPDPKKPDEINI